MLGLKQKLVARKERKYWNLLQEVTTLRETVCSKRESERERRIEICSRGCSKRDKPVTLDLLSLRGKVGLRGN